MSSAVQRWAFGQDGMPLGGWRSAAFLALSQARRSEPPTTTPRVVGEFAETEAFPGSGEATLAEWQVHSPEIWDWMPDAQAQAQAQAPWEVPRAWPIPTRWTPVPNSDPESPMEDPGGSRSDALAEAIEHNPQAQPSADITWGPRFTFAELVDQEALNYASWGNDLGLLLSRTMCDLAARIRFTGAQTVEEFEARSALLEQWSEEAAELTRQEPLLSPYDLLP